MRPSDRAHGGRRLASAQVKRVPVDDPDDPRIAEFVGLRERALRQGLRPADPRHRLPDPPAGPPAAAPGGPAGRGSASGGTGSMRPTPGAGRTAPAAHAAEARDPGSRSLSPAGGPPVAGTAAQRPRLRSPGAAAGVFVAEGDIVVQRAIEAGYRLRSLLVDATRRAPLPPPVEKAEAATSTGAGETAPAVPVYAASPAVLQRITGLGVHRGILGSFDRRPPRPASELLADPAVRRVVVLERVSNPTNLGVILRSARGLGIDAALLDPTCTDPLYRRVARVAMGEGYAFPWAVLPRLPGGLDPVRSAGFRLVALTPDPEATPIDTLAPGPGDRVALLLGAEGPGLSAETMDAADVRAGIPMRAGVDSLNVGVAAGIAFWVLGRRHA